MEVKQIYKGVVTNDRYLVRLMNRVIYIFLVCVLSGCGTTMVTYDGEKKSNDQVAVIRINAAIEIEQIDGQKMSKSITTSHMQVLPGVREMSFSFRRVQHKGSLVSSKRPIKILVNAEANKLYHVYIKFLDRGGWLPIIVEDSTGKVVSYRKGKNK